MRPSGAHQIKSLQGSPWQVKSLHRGEMLSLDLTAEKKGSYFFRRTQSSPFNSDMNSFTSLKSQINRGEANIRNFVELLDAIHQEFAHFLAGLALAFGRLVDKALHLIDQRLQQPVAAGAFSQDFSKPCKIFLAVESFAAAVLLDNHVGDFVDALVGGMAAPAFQAFAAAAKIRSPARPSRESMTLSSIIEQNGHFTA